MEKPMKKLLSAVVAAVMSLSAVPVAAFASDDLPQTDSFYDTLGYASKSQYVLYSESESSMQLNVNRAVINGNVYTNGNLDAYAGEVLVRGDLFVGKTVNKHEHTILDSYRYYENAQKGVMNDFEDEMTASLGEDYVTHEWWYTYSNPDTTLTDSVYAKSGLQFTGNNVTLGGTYVSESYLMISASHALTTAPDNQMNLYCQNGNIGIYVGDAQINGIIYAPNGTVQICGSDIEINGLVIAKEIQISAQDFTINEDPTLSMSENAWLYNDALLAITGSYNEESDSIDISMLSSLEEGTYSIFSSDDNAEFENVASVSENTYSLLLSDTNDIYIKAQQTFDNGFTIESNTIKFVYTENGFEEEISDTDNEGLIDLYEHIIGSDMNNADTDGDGLSDYIEASILGTDPRYTDTDEDGVTDAYEDNDSDRLTNIDEVNAKTDPTLYDTDGDQLSDYDEIYIYSTDPLLYDTDGDGLNDGDEISLGLDPLSADTDNNGIADNNEKFEQKVNTPELETFNTDNEYELSVDITSSGYAPRIIDVSESVYSEAVTSEAVLGKIVELKAKESCNVSQVVLKFDIADEYTNSQSEILAEDMQGIERFMVFKYFDQINMLLPIDTQYDIQNNLVYTAVDELGSYCVVDMEKWCSQLSSSVNQQTFSLYSARNDLSADTPIDIVFALRSYYTDSYLTEFESYRDMICDVSQLLFESYENVRVYIIEDDTTADFVKPLHYSSSGERYFDNTDDLKYAMNLLTASFVSAETNTDYPYDLIIKNSIFRNSPNRYVFEVGYEGENSVLNRNAFDYFVSKDLMYSDLDVNSDNTLRFKHYQMSLDNSGEIYTAKITERNENATAYDIFSYIEENLVAEDLPSADEDDGEYTIVLPTSWENVTLLGELSPDNGIDTDGDTLTDWQEADTKSGLISIDENGNILLPTFEECLESQSDRYYVENVLQKFKNDHNKIYSLFSNARILPIISNPCNVDTDGDGYDDDIDPEKFRRTFITPFGTNDYIQDITNYAKNKFNSLNAFEKLLCNNDNKRAEFAIEAMMRDVNECPYTYLVSDEDWLRFCLFFNENVQEYNKVDEELHYFRNKLNRAPATLDEMINLINSTTDDDDKWILFSLDHTLYHMFGTDGEYNLKFVSSTNSGNTFEAVYNIDGVLLTEKNDPSNMGTYNYCSDQISIGKHQTLDVKPYKLYGNVSGVLYPGDEAKDENRQKYDRNDDAKTYREYYETLENILME